MRIGIYELLIWLLHIWCSINCSLGLGFDPVDNYLILCASSVNKSINGRVFVSDYDYADSNMLSTLRNASIESNLTSVDSALYHTARILFQTSSYSFQIRKLGRHFIRLYFYPLVNENYDLSTARFSVSAQNFTLLRDFEPQNGPVMKEYSLNISSNTLVLSFTSSSNSFAFLNALEIVSLPDELIPVSAQSFVPPQQNYVLDTRALETVYRVNMGNVSVSPQNDTLWRSWVSDGTFLQQSNVVDFISYIETINYTRTRVSENIAPASVYRTATRLNTQNDPNSSINMTWSFDIDPGFEYFVRFHFCDIIAEQQPILLNLFANSWLVASDLDLGNLTSYIPGAPYYMDVVANLGISNELVVSISPSFYRNSFPNGILNGLEIMKVSNTRRSLDAKDAVIYSTNSRSNSRIWVIAVVSAVGSLFIIGIIILAFFISRRTRKGHLENEVVNYPDESIVISRSKIWYRFNFATVKEATNNFGEDGLIGVGGFGKVYKGILKDNTKVAIKRGISQSQQGLAEFKTEIEMLSRFRHRHLVSLIGYCDEKKEMIIIYEYMENGTLKNHLYGSDLPKLNWKQRVKICIGSARGLHYLHTAYSTPIIHRDVKSANILLDENLMAKVADFGLSKNGPDLDQTHVSTAVKGSFGYLDPEYLITQQLTEKSDVYSFGSVLLEIVCGRAVIDPSLPKERVNLIEWSLRQLKCGAVKDIVDPHLVDEIKSESLTKFCETAEKCLAERGIDRPTMGDVLWNLECALQLQGNDQDENERSDRSDDNLISRDFEMSVSNSDFSMGSADDIAGITMSRVFSQMVRSEMS